MPQKRRLELKPHRELKTREFYPTKKFVFVLDLQIFYERGTVLKTVLPSGQIKYISLQNSFDSFKAGRSVGLGYLKKDRFYWIDFYPNASFSLCVEWVTAFTRHLKVSLFLFCILFYPEVKKKNPNFIFGIFIYYLICFLDISGWGIPFDQPSFKLFSENRHFLSVCISTVNDLPVINLSELNSSSCRTEKKLISSEELSLTQLNHIGNNNISLPKKIKRIYWVIQQVSLKKISGKFSIKTWGICADLLLYYAQSLRLWIP